MKNESILCLDIGSGTQDALLYSPDAELANCPKFVLPSPAKRVAERIRGITAKGRPIHLSGRNMGGGFADALLEHMRAGFSVTASMAAAAALHDDPERVRAMGVTFAEVCPSGAETIELGDFDPVFWRDFLDRLGLEMPRTVAVAAQDHGFHPSGNREGRMEMWRRFLSRDQGDPTALIYFEDAAPLTLTRLRAIQERSLGPVADSGAAAVLGALSMPELERRSWREGITVLNAGNGHTLAFLVYQGRVWGVYEQHTAALTPESLARDLEEFRLGWLPDEVVRNAGGHGCALSELPPEAEGFRPTFVLGPRRDSFPGAGKLIHPGGDMMLAGAYGLLYGIKSRQKS